MGKAIAVAGMFGAIGNMAMNAASKNDFALMPINYKCMRCKNKFETLPVVAPDNEVLSQGCTVNFHRLSAFTGMAVSQQVYLNGVKVGAVKNKSDLVFKTYTKHNTVFVLDQYGLALPGIYRFEAQDGGVQEINYRRKFV